MVRYRIVTSASAFFLLYSFCIIRKDCRVTKGLPFMSITYPSLRKVNRVGISSFLKAFDQIFYYLLIASRLPLTTLMNYKRSIDGIVHYLVLYSFLIYITVKSIVKQFNIDCMLCCSYNRPLTSMSIHMMQYDQTMTLV